MDAISEDWGRLRLAVCNDFYKRKLITQDDYQRQVKQRLAKSRGLVKLRGATAIPGTQGYPPGLF